MSVHTTAVQVPTSDGVADAVLAVPDDGSPHPGVLLYPDAFGLRPQIERMCARLAREGYAVLAPNVFYRGGRAPVVELGDLRDGERRRGLFNRLRPHMRALTPARVVRDADAYLDHLACSDRVGERPVGVVGYCMGGGLALRTAAHAPGRVAVVASFHAGRLATDDLDSPHLGFGAITGEVYIAHADHDASMPPRMQRRVAEALERAGVRHRVERYDGAAHGFAMADTAAHDEDAERRHWAALLDVLGRNLH